MALQDLLPRKVAQNIFAPIGNAPPTPDLSMNGPVPVLPPIVAAAVTTDPRMSSLAADPLERRKSELNADLYKRSNPIAPTTTLGKIGHVAANVGNVLGDIFAPDVMASIPGTQLYNERIRNRDQDELAKVSQEQTAEGQRKQEAALTDYTEQRPEIERAKVLQKLTSTLAPKGIKATMNEDGTIDTADDTESQAYKDRVGLDTYRAALGERAQIQSDNQKNHYVPGTPQFVENQRKLDQIDTRLHTALAGIGIQRGRLEQGAERLGFNEDQAYNPQPTGTERTKGDLADSAAHYVDIMHDVRMAHPDLFGPGGGQATKLTAWLGSQDPEAQRYLAAATTAKDHLTAVFGARSKYALEGTGTLFDPKMNNAAFEAEYGDLKDSIGSFQKAGTTHGKGQMGHAAQQGGAPSGPAEHYERVNGKLVKVTK